METTKIFIYGLEPIKDEETVELSKKEIEVFQNIGYKLPKKPTFKEVLLRVVNIQSKYRKYLDKKWMKQLEPTAIRFE